MAKGDQAPTYGGVLTGSAAIVVATLLAVGAVLAVGWKAHDVVTAAQASEVPADVRKDIADIKIAIGKINCRLNIEGTCPEAGPAVRTSGVSR